MTPKLRTIFYHVTLSGGQKTVKNPAGWKKTVISLDRSDTYHTLIESFKSSALWYGNARETLLSIKTASGANAEIRVTMEVKFSELGIYELIFDGLIKLAQIEEIFEGIRSNKINAPIIRNGFWSKFHNRYDRPVNLESTTDLDGGTRTDVNKTTVLMRGQTIQVKFQRSTTYNTPDAGLFSAAQAPGALKNYIMFDNSYNVLDEVETREEYGNQISSENPTDVRKYILLAKYAGEYRFELTARYQLIFSSSVNPTVKLFRAIRNASGLTVTQVGTTDSAGGVFDLSGVKVLDLTTNLNVGDEFYLYWEVDLNITISNLIFLPDFDTDLGPGYAPVYTSFVITAKTEFPDTTTDAYLLKEAAESIISKYVGANSPLVSTKFGSTTFNRNAIFRGKHNRGFSFSQKQMSMSMKNWWEGAEPVFNLCLGYTKVLGVDKIFIEDKSYAYNPTPIVNLSNARNLVRRYDLEKFFSSIEFGFNKGQTESASGIDDHQTKRTYNTNLKTFGNDFKNLSQFFCAALAIEQSRRKRVEQGKDDRLDEELMMVSIIPGSPWSLEFDENFDNVNNILNPTKRANLRHSAVRVFKRWQNAYNPSLQTSESFVFGKGEGNYDPTTRLDPLDYEATANPDELVDEKGSRQANGARLWVPEIWELSDYKMDWNTYKQIRDNKENAIGLSRTEANYAPMFITSLDFELFQGGANMILLQATNAEP